MLEVRSYRRMESIKVNNIPVASQNDIQNLQAEIDDMDAFDTSLKQAISVPISNTLSQPSLIISNNCMKFMIYI